MDTRHIGGLLGLVFVVLSGSAHAQSLAYPSAPSPAINAVNVPTTATLAWQSTGAKSYDVYFGTSSSPAKVANVLGAAYAPALQAATKYYWRVVARYSDQTTTGPLWTFTTASAAAGAPTVHSPSPANGAVNVPIPTKITWQGSGATLGYDFYFGTSPSPGKRATVMVASFIPDLTPGMKYYWRVVARGATSYTSSPVWSFTTASVAQTPIDCVLSSWTMASASQWSACSSSGTQTRSELWTRTILVAPKNGGKACGVLSETRTGTQSCSLPSTSSPPPAGGLLTKSNLVYEGAFRVPVGTGTASYNYGGTALTYHPGHNSLLLVGHDWTQQVGEISIPAPGLGAKVTDLPRATTIQPLTDVLQGKLTTIDGNTTNGVKVGGLIVQSSSIVVSAWSYYDAGVQKQTKSHFVTGQNFGSLGTVAGPFQVGAGFQQYGTDTTRIAGFVSGYMATIPSAWQGALGGTHLTGQGGMISIVDRTSSGPSATVFTPSELGVPNSPTALVMGYPTGGGGLNHPTLGVWGKSGGLYNGTQGFRGMVFPDGTRSILYFGWGGTTFCYGAGTDDQSLDPDPSTLTDNKPHPAGGVWCYDPVNSSKGTHGYPYSSIVWAYDAEDFLKAKAGILKPWEVKPYATWNLSLPFQNGRHEILGATYDAAAKRVFLSASFSEGAMPVIHVFRLP
jgi:hypothetical protein